MKFTYYKCTFYYRKYSIDKTVFNFFLQKVKKIYIS